MKRRQPQLRRAARRGIALLDVIIGGLMLGIALTAIISVTTRALARQTQGEKQLIAAWLIDGLLNEVLVEGPDNFKKSRETAGRFEEPFSDFDFDLGFEDMGIGQPYKVTARVSWLSGAGISDAVVETYISTGSSIAEMAARAPQEPIDRYLRWNEDVDE